MNPHALPMLLAVVAGFVLAFGWDRYERTAYAKAHSTLTFIGGLLVVILAGFAAVVFVHDAMAWLLVLMGYVGFTKLKEARVKRQNFAAATVDYRKKVQSALEARSGNEAIEIDVTSAPEGLLWTLINDSKKQGLTVETVKSHTSKEVRLRLSGTASDKK